MDPTAYGSDAVSELVRVEGSWVLATLARTVGSLDLAQDALQDATERALRLWPRMGVPPNPRGWLMLTARRRAVDILRRESLRRPKEAEAARGLWSQRLSSEDEVTLAEGGVPDDLLRLLFTCCHPSLSLEAQVALSLRTLCGFSTAEVARALLVPEPTMAKRLTRTRQKIARAAIPYAVPRVPELPARVAAVAAVLYLIYNEGYAATAGPDGLRAALTTEAIRLTRVLVGLLPGRASLTGLLALMLLQEARRPARLGADGELLLLAEQDRSRWDQALVREGVLLVGEGLRLSAGIPDTYVVQAAIAACHDLARSYEDTDWAGIASWYDVLLGVQETPVTRLNAAVAVAGRDGPAAGLALANQIEGLQRYPTWHATRGELLLQQDRAGAATAAFEAALTCEMNDAQRVLLERRLAVARNSPPGGARVEPGTPPTPAPRGQ